MISGEPVSPLDLLRARRFGPLFVAQFLGAFNDNLYKQALVVLVTFTLAPQHGAALSALAGAVFILPFLLVSVTAGRIADRADMGRLVRVLKAIEALLMGLAAVALLAQDLILLFVTLFLLGLQAAFFGPVKYAILPRHLARRELVTGNALVEGATFLAILAGSILGGLMTGTDAARTALAVLMALVGIGGAVAAWFVPSTEPAQPDLRLPKNPLRDTLAVIAGIRASSRAVWLAILGVSWFWAVGAVVLSLVPAFARDGLRGDEATATTILALFSIGIAVGSLLCSRVMGAEISARLAPAAALALGLALILVGLAPRVGASQPEMAGLAAFATGPGALTTLALAIAATAAGFYAVPLYAIIQTAGDAGAVARAIAVNNVVNAACMIAASVATAIGAAAGLKPWDIVAVTGALCLVSAAAIAGARRDGLP